MKDKKVDKIRLSSSRELSYVKIVISYILNVILIVIISYIKKAIMLYIDSFRKLKKLSWRIIISMLIDFVYLISIIAILMFANAKLAYYTQSEILPMAKEIGIIRSAQIDAVNQKTDEIDSVQLKESSEKIPSILSGLKSSLNEFLFVLGISLVLIIILTTLSKTINWSFARGSFDSFSSFSKFMLYNLVWVTVSMIILVGSFFLLNESVLPKILLLYFFLYIYLSSIFSSKFNQKLPLFLPFFKQYLTYLKFSIIYFYKQLIPIIFIIITGLICVGIILLSGYLFPILIINILMLLLLLFFMSWFRLYMYNINYE